MRKTKKYQKSVKIHIDMQFSGYETDPQFDEVPAYLLQNVNELTITYDHGRLGSSGPVREKLVSCFPRVRKVIFGTYNQRKPST